MLLALVLDTLAVTQLQCGAYLNNCLPESEVAAPTDPMHTNELPSDSSTGRDQHEAAENATFMSSKKHEKHSGLLSRKISARRPVSRWRLTTRKM